MRTQPPILASKARRGAGAWRFALCLGLCFAAPAAPAPAQAPEPPTPTPQAPVVLDKVVAVVNRRVILASDIDEEMRLSILDPDRIGQGILTRKRALDQLISRALIEQQIRREDEQAEQPSQNEVNARLMEIRRDLPACVRQNCASEQGWIDFLAAHDLTPERVEAYARYRIEILHFIEERFRPGIHISPQEIETYYRQTLMPQYAPGEAVPTLDRVSFRIQEILLQQQVNLLFDEWLTNLRKQGDVEVFDEALESSDPHSGAQSILPGAVGNAIGAKGTP